MYFKLKIQRSSPICYDLWLPMTSILSKLLVWKFCVALQKWSPFVYVFKFGILNSNSKGRVYKDWQIKKVYTTQNRLIIIFFVSQPILRKLREIIVLMSTKISPKFHQNWLKNNFFLLMCKRVCRSHYLAEIEIANGINYLVILGVWWQAVNISV